MDSDLSIGEYNILSYDLQNPPVSSPPQPNSLPIFSFQQNQNVNELDKIFDSEILPITLLNRHMGNNTQQFSVSHFINELRSLPNLNMTDYDKTFFQILITAEIGDFVDILPTKALKEFGVRFGPWIKIVEKVREFVADGARHWFYGKCDSKQANEILSKYGNEHEYFLIRSVPVVAFPNPDRKYVFAISYRNTTGKICHFQIYKDFEGRLCMVNDVKEVEYFSSFRNIIGATVKIDPKPIKPNPTFTCLEPQIIKVFDNSKDPVYDPIESTRNT